MKPRSRLLFSGASLPLTQASGSFIGLSPAESFINTYLFIQKKASFPQMAMQASVGNDAFVRKLAPPLARALIQTS
jgi:hypothetical protein